MQTQVRQGSTTSILRYFQTPATKYVSSRTDMSSISLTSDKSSVNAGKFTPGIFRINPYVVYREEYDRVNSSFADHAFATPWTYDSLITGEFGEYFANRIKSVVASTSMDANSGTNRALQKAYGKLVASEAGLGETLGELKETLMMLRSPLKSARKLLSGDVGRKLRILKKELRDIKSGKTSWIRCNGGDTAQAVADTWLEVRYGLLPLMYTIQDLIKLANKQVGALSTSIQCKVANVRAEVPTPLISPTFGAQLGYTEFQCTIRGVDSYLFHASVQYRLLGLPTNLDLLGLSPQYLPELVWELTTLSFVVDWWLDVGAWLASLRFNPTISVLGNTVTRKLDRNVSVSGQTRVASISTGNPWTSRQTLGGYRLLKCERLTNRSLPILPQFKPEFKSYLHIVDALALSLKPIIRQMRKP